MVLAIDQTARRYHTLPSKVLGLHDPHRARDFDLAVTQRMRAIEGEELVEATRDEKSGFFGAVLTLLRRI